MKVCDRCVMQKATFYLRLISGGDCLQESWQLCGDCFTYVIEDAKKGVNNYLPPSLSQFCPSLTPDQRKQVGLYILSRGKQP